jgi:hypothetical protein
MTTLSYIGAYVVHVPASEREVAIQCQGSTEAAESELKTLALVELEVLNAPQDFQLAELHQSHTQCCPYNEEYFSLGSLKPIPTEPYSKPAVANFRVAFHLHFYDPLQLLKSPMGRSKLASSQFRHLTLPKSSTSIGTSMANKLVKFARTACPTHNVHRTLFAAHR